MVAEWEKEIAKERQGTRTDLNISSNLNESSAPIRTAAEAAKMVGTFSVTTDEVFPKRKNLGRTENVHLRSPCEYGLERFSYNRAEPCKHCKSPKNGHLMTGSSGQKKRPPIDETRGRRSCRRPIKMKGIRLTK